MPRGAPKGHPKYAGSGRPKGCENKTTADVRKTIALMAERNVEKFEGWMLTVAKTDPHKAATLFLQAIEYHIPKLARSEVSGNNGGPIQTESTVILTPDEAYKRMLEFKGKA
jgi:hypothetical protein